MSTLAVTRPVQPTIAFGLLSGLLALGILLVGRIVAPDAISALGLVTLAFLAGMAFAAHRVWVFYPHPVLGGCNAVTQLRAALAALLALPILSPDLLETARFDLLVIAGVALALDGVDGWLARRAGLCSGFGARFDMEVDAVVAAILAGLLLAETRDAVTIAALLVLGFARYGFVAAGWLAPWLMGPLPERWSRKFICVVQISALIAALAWPGFVAVIPPVALAVLWSFARDIRWLAERRP